MNVERRLRGVGRRPAPEFVDQAVTGDDLVRVEEQNHQQRALLRAAERKRAAVLEHFERTEDPVLHLLSSSPLAAL